MREETVEQYLVRRVKALGGECYKWVSPGRRGVPDRFCVVPEWPILFLELKRPGKKPTKAQFRELRRLAELGQTVDWANSKEMVDEALSMNFGAKQEF